MQQVNKIPSWMEHATTEGLGGPSWKVQAPADKTC